MVIHDLQCSKCGAIFLDKSSDRIGRRHGRCLGLLEVVFLPKRPKDASVHSSERVVLYHSEREGKFQYPGRADQPIPARLQARGYVRREFSSAHDLIRHERRENVCSHALNYDRNGHSFDGSDS